MKCFKSLSIYLISYIEPDQDLKIQHVYLFHYIFILNLKLQQTPHSV